MKMKRYLFSLLALFSFISLRAQIEKPSTWQFEVVPAKPAVGSMAEVVAKVTIIDKWYLYSNDFDPNLGPLLTEIKFEKPQGYELVGKLKAIKPKKKFDDVWGGDITYFTKKGEFRQQIKITSENPVVKGTYEGQVCTDIDGKCINVEGDFELKVATSASSIPASAKPEPSATLIAPEQIQSPTEQVPAPAQITDIQDTANAAKTLQTEQAALVETISDDDLPGGKNQGLLAFMLLAFLSGLVALITPCVFPMVPMTVTFFTRQTKSKSEAIGKALFFGFSIIFLYTVAGTLVARINGPEFANFLSTHWAPNIFFFLIFVVFGVSFLGLFEIVLPSSLVNSADKQADKGGLYGIFFMAFTLVLVSFSCTGPIVGTILVASAGGEWLKPIAGMFAFSAAFAVPFTLFAIFPQWLSGLPKSGGWLNSVKVVLGFLELALALKFLSIADQAYHWGLLDREIYLAAWIVIFSMIGIYLLGKIRLPHDSVLESVGIPRIILAIITFTFVVYMIPGMWGAPLKGLSGYLPPMTTQDFQPQAALNTSSNLAGNANLCEQPLYADKLHLPHGLQGYFDYKQAVECAKKVNKPIFIDFTGHGCVNCREMEANVWSDPKVLQKLNNDFVVLALYVDDKTELPEALWYTSAYDKKVKKTIGKQNADRQVMQFKNNAQPYYILLSPDEKLLAVPKAYDLNISNFLAFLDEGIDRYKAGKSLVMPD
jgi:thiol:disulfide interchange protein DsbD